MRCRIRCNRYIVAIRFAIISCYLNRVSSCFQTDRAGNLLTIHFNNNIGQTVRRYNERNRIDSLCDKMNIFIKCKVLSTAGKQVNFCSFRVYIFCIVQVIAIGNHRHTCIENCRDIICIRIPCINLCFFYGKSTVTAHGVFTVSGYFGAALDQNIAFCPYCAVRSRGAFYLAAANRQIALGKQSGIMACCFHLGVDNFNFARAVFIAHIHCVKLILACAQNNLTVVFDFQFLGACSSVIGRNRNLCAVNGKYSFIIRSNSAALGRSYIKLCTFGYADVAIKRIECIPFYIDCKLTVTDNIVIITATVCKNSAAVI